MARRPSGLPAAVAAGVVVLGFTRPGRSPYAPGGDIEAVKAAGIGTYPCSSVDWPRRACCCHVLVSGLATTGLLPGRIAAMQGDGDVFAVTVTGGVSLTGTVFGTFMLVARTPSRITRGCEQE